MRLRDEFAVFRRMHEHHTQKPRRRHLLDEVAPPREVIVGGAVSFQGSLVLSRNVAVTFGELLACSNKSAWSSVSTGLAARSRAAPSRGVFDPFGD